MSRCDGRGVEDVGVWYDMIYSGENNPEVSQVRCGGMRIYRAFVQSRK